MSQREVGVLLGYANSWQISRHEREATTPPLLAALAYELIFQTPVSVLFAGLRAKAAGSIEPKLAAYERGLNPNRGNRSAARAAGHKLAWLERRRTS